MTNFESKSSVELSEQDIINISYLSWILIESEGKSSIEQLAEDFMKKFPEIYSYDPLEQDFLKVRQPVEDMISAYVNMGYFMQEGNLVFLKNQEINDLEIYLQRAKEIIEEFKNGKNHLEGWNVKKLNFNYVRTVLAIEFSPKRGSKKEKISEEIYNKMYKKFNVILNKFVQAGLLGIK
jgi:hypothetical protein